MSKMPLSTPYHYGLPRTTRSNSRQVTRTSLVRSRRSESVLRGRQLVLQLPQPELQGGDVGLQLEDPAHALETDPRGGQLGDLAQQLDVAPRVSATPAPRPAGGDQPETVVGPQRLRVQPG